MMPKQDQRDSASREQGLADLDITAAHPPRPEDGQAGAQPDHGARGQPGPGLENQNLTRPAGLDVRRAP